MVNRNGLLYFVLDQENQVTIDGALLSYLLQSDGTPTAGTMVVPNLTTLTSFQNLTNVNGALFFTAYHHSYGEELFRLDGSGVKLRDVRPGSESFSLTI